MSTTQQPDALQIAATLEALDMDGAADAVRRLHAENTTLRQGYDAARLEIESLRAGREQGSSCASKDLAVMVLSDCGHSSNYTPLLDRVAGRIDRHVERLLTAQHSDRAARAQAAPEVPAAGVPLDELAELSMLNQLIDLGNKAAGFHATANSDDGRKGTAAYVQWQETRAKMGELIRATYAAAPQPPAAAQEPVKLPPPHFERVAEGVEVGYDVFGGVDIRLGGEFVYVHINYDHHYTDNASRKRLADQIVGLLTDTATQQAAHAEGDALTQAARDVLAERQRQISAEGWAPERDDQYMLGELALAGAAYAMQSIDADSEDRGCIMAPNWWPWSQRWWKPTSRRRMLEKAGALILAELERIDRAAMAAQNGGA